jgi:ribosome-associated protein
MKNPEKITPVKKNTRRFKKNVSVEVIAQALRDKKAQDIVALDLTSLGAAICDYFVVAHADSGTQVVALADNVEKEMHEQIKENPMRVQGKENAFWIILDYGNVVVHLFQTEWRLFYRLEELWADAPQKKYKD